MSVNINDDIDRYLDATAGLHNGVDSKKFGEMVKKIGIQDGFTRVTKKGIADAMGISRTTFHDYLGRYNTKHGNAQHNDNAAI